MIFLFAIIRKAQYAWHKKFLELITYAKYFAVK